MVASFGMPYPSFLEIKIVSRMPWLVDQGSGREAVDAVKNSSVTNPAYSIDSMISNPGFSIGVL